MQPPSWSILFFFRFKLTLYIEATNRNVWRFELPPPPCRSGCSCYASARPRGCARNWWRYNRIAPSHSSSKNVESLLRGAHRYTWSDWVAPLEWSAYLSVAVKCFVNLCASSVSKTGSIVFFVNQCLLSLTQCSVSNQTACTNHTHCHCDWASLFTI